MKRSFIFAVALLLNCNAFCQVTAMPANLRAEMTLDRLRHLSPNDLTYGIPLPDKKLVGDAYLHGDWKPGSMLLYASETFLEGYPVRYDMLRDEMEVKSRSGIKVIQGIKIKSFVWVDTLKGAPEYFVNAKDYKSDDGVPLNGFFQIMADGKLPLFKQTKATIQKANYVVQFDVGSRDDKIVKDDKFYYASDGKVFAVPGSRKKLLPLFGDQREKIEQFIRINSLNLKTEHHLQKIFEYYNSLN
jgi:hypothetical protein